MVKYYLMSLINVVLHLVNIKIYSDALDFFINKKNITVEQIQLLRARSEDDQFNSIWSVGFQLV